MTRQQNIVRVLPRVAVRVRDQWALDHVGAGGWAGTSRTVCSTPRTSWSGSVLTLLQVEPLAGGRGAWSARLRSRERRGRPTVGGNGPHV